LRSQFADFAGEILDEKADELDRVAAALLERRSLDADEIARAMEGINRWQ